MSKPSLAELKAVCQPESLLGRVEAEHWAGRLYMRRVSPYVTRLIIVTQVTPNGVTWMMIATGLLAALSLTRPGLLGAVGAFALIQMQLLFDCCDGEVARWRRSFSLRGVYLDRIGHYSTEAALPSALGVRADGGFDQIGGWTTLGLLISVLVLFLKSETHLVTAVRAQFTKEPTRVPVSLPTPAASRRAWLRDGVRLLPVFRPFQAVEATLVALFAATVDTLGGSLSATRALLLVLVAFGAVAVSGHLIAILTSDRLR